MTRTAFVVGWALVVLCLLAFVLFLGTLPPTAEAAQTTISGVDMVTVMDAQQIGVSTTVTSSAFTPLGRSTVQSVQYRASGFTNPNLQILVVGSLDESSDAQLDAGQSVTTSLRDSNWHLAPLRIPMCKRIKFVVQNLSSTQAPNLTLIVGSQ